MTEHERRVAAYLSQVRAKYSQKQIDALGAKGHAFKNPDGHYSYPIDDADDLGNAIHAVGRGGADHDAIRAYVIRRAKALGLSDKIPENWNSDGSLKGENAAKMPTGSSCPSCGKQAPAGANYCPVCGAGMSSAGAGKSDGDPSPRSEPTPEDWEVTYGLKSLKAAAARVKAEQLLDPDHGTDPDDAAVMTAIDKIEAAIDEALVAQSKDGHPDKPARSTVPAVPKRSFWSMKEQPVPVEQTVEIRMEGTGSPTEAQFRGYASVTGVPYDVHDWLGQYSETIERGAFAKTLGDGRDVPLLFDHGGLPLASTSSRTSRLSEDGKGLLNEAVLDRSGATTNEVCLQLQRGVLNKMSFSFQGMADTWNDAYDQRAVTEAKLFDTSIVTYPANPATTAELRSGMIEALGREGVSLMFSSRAALLTMDEALPEAAEPTLEQAIRALALADEISCKRGGNAGFRSRARTFLVAALMEQVRKGATLSGKNKQLLQDAVDALSGAAKQHKKMADAHAKAANAVNGVLDTAAGANNTGVDGDQGGGSSGSKNPILPQDGAGPRSLPPAVAKARRQVELLKLGR